MRRAELNIRDEKASDRSFALQELGATLCSFYRSTLAEPLPEEFLRLLEQLEDDRPQEEA